MRGPQQLSDDATSSGGAPTASASRHSPQYTAAAHACRAARAVSTLLVAPPPETVSISIGIVAAVPAAVDDDDDDDGRTAPAAGVKQPVSVASWPLSRGTSGPTSAIHERSAAAHDPACCCVDRMTRSSSAVRTPTDAATPGGSPAPIQWRRCPDSVHAAAAMDAPGDDSAAEDDDDDGGDDDATAAAAAAVPARWNSAGLHRTAIIGWDETDECAERWRIWCCCCCCCC
jgi:hypothetical protein